MKVSLRIIEVVEINFHVMPLAHRKLFFYFRRIFAGERRNRGAF